MIIDLKETTHSPDTQRHRLLEDWSISSIYGNDKSIIIYRLVGKVVTEFGVPLDVLRFTTTSPIAKCESGTITTASGSTYKLGTPSKYFLEMLNGMNLEYSKDSPIPDLFMNEWLEGDNWLTI